MQSEQLLRDLAQSKSLTGFTILDVVEFPTTGNVDEEKEVSNCIFNKRVIFNSFRHPIDFKDCIFKEGITIKGESTARAVRINFYKCEILELIGLDKSRIDHIRLDECTFAYRGIIIDNITGERLDIHKSYLLSLAVYSSVCMITESKINKLCSMNNHLTVSYSDLGRCVIKKVYQKLIRISNNTFESLIFSGVFDNFKMDNNSILKLTFYKSTFKSKSTISNSTIKDKFSIIGSDIDKLIIKDTDVSNTTFVIRDSNLFSTQFDTVKWPLNPFIDDETPPFHKDDTKKLTKSQIREWQNNENTRIQNIYRQLKQSAEAINDKINYQKFKAYELDRYYKSLKLFHRKEYALKINLWFSRYSNFFGLWWLAPICYYFIVTYFLFFILSGFHFPLIPQEIGNSLNADFARFLNPTHNLSNIVFLDSSNWLVIVGDYFCRICQGLLAYQTIMGFRKSFF